MTKAKKIVIGCFVAVTALIMIGMATDVFAGRSGDTIIVNVDSGTDVTEITEMYSIDDKTVAELVAKSAACDHSFYWGKPGKWQVSPQVAYYDSELEACIGGAFRPTGTDVMFNLSFVPDEDTDEWLFQGGALIILD